MNFRVNISICRVCMKSDDGVSLLDDEELCEKFVFTTRLKLTESDDMPSLICSKCLKRLRVAYDFVKSAHDSEKNLKAFLEKISKDFQLVTNNAIEKSNNNEDEDDLLSNILDEENTHNKTEASTQMPAQKDESAISASETSSSVKSNNRKTAIGKTENSVDQITLKTTSSSLGDTSEDISKDIHKNKMNLNVKKGSADKEIKTFPSFESDIQVEIEENLDDITNCEVETPKEHSPEHEIQILEYTDEESQTELEILEENLQPSDDTGNSLGTEEPQPQSSGGFLKEYQAMLDEDGEFLKDNSSIHEKTTTAKELHYFDDSEELLDDHDIEMKSMVEDNLDEEQSVDTSSQVRTEVAEKEIKSKTRKYQAKTNVRSPSAKSARKGDTLNTTKRFLCFKCNRDFSTKTNLTRHMATHEGNRPFQCNVCNKSFTQNVSLKQHMYTHTGEKPYQCEVCHRGFTQCKSLVFHIRRHTGDKPFPCEKCGALFRQKDGLKTHILKRHTIKSKRGNMELTTCAICKEVFADKSLLQEHMKKHLNDYVRVDSAMSCANREGTTEENSDMLLEYIDDDPLHDKANGITGESTSESTDDIGSSAHVVDLMTTSALEPSRAKKFQCRKCFKCFAIKKNLLRHLTTHELSVETDFVCKICELCFATSEDLKAHTIKEHTNSTEPFQCELCESAFSNVVELKKHMDLHNTKTDKSHGFVLLRKTLKLTNLVLSSKQTICGKFLINYSNSIFIYKENMEVCRICGGAERLKCFHGDEQLTELLRVCANIAIEENDFLPQHICEQCENGLRFSYHLRKQSEQTEKRLRQEMQTQTNSTTINILDEFDPNDVNAFDQTADVIRHKSLISEININISTTTQESNCVLIEENHTQEIIESTSLCMEIKEHQSIVEILDEDNLPELTAEERLRLDLQKRGVDMQKRLVPIENVPLNEIVHEVIAEKRIQLDLDTHTDVFSDMELPADKCLEILNNEFNEVNDEDDIIEVIDDDSMPGLADEEFSTKQVCQTLNACEYQDENFVEEILSSDEESQCNQTDVVYEENSDGVDDSNNIDDCEMHFMKEESSDFPGNECTENESVTTQEIEKDETTIGADGETPSDASAKEPLSEYTCSTCDLKLPTWAEYCGHIKTHGDKRFLCKICNTWFPLRSRLEKHLLSHEDKQEKPECPHCGRTFQNRYNLKRHINDIHDSIAHMCVICGKAFLGSDVLQVHLATHIEDEELRCEHCSRCFSRRSTLTNHMKTHLKSATTKESEKVAKSDVKNTAGKNVYCCHYCGKESKHHFTHKMHMRIHTQERPHKCDACDKAFRTMAALITHQRIHEDVRPYQCEHCLLSFRQQAHLKEHRMIHEGITPHKCSICQLSFTKKSNMLVHMRIHSGENPYKCVICDKQFKKAALLRKHESEVHNKNTTEEQAGDSPFIDLAEELVCSDSNSLEVIETENASSIESSAISNVGDVQQGFEEMPEVIRNAVLEQNYCNNPVNNDSEAVDSGVVLVVDDNAKFNSLFIMDD
ncbi:uncharacterized protein LOC126758378 [Bactrocera neohumeralis]|uniref:uncharacterized protein LOC126758378 n=1 Tax=Bactrocera neohumeralis TaxID=98809 RepID=UPI002165592F|nr:uncharacterized protein LOC126758378 [Bactrocera neohumeralis]